MAARRRLAKVAACVQSGSNSTGSAAPPRLGFVGIGTINSAVIRGLCTAASADDALPPLHWPIMVGPRNAAKAAALVSEFPSQVRQASTNQEVLDGSDVVLLGTPGGADSLREVCSALRWRTDHRVISLVAGAPYELLSDATQPAAAATIALPLPPAEWHASTTKVFPRNQEAEALMSRLGTVLAFDSFEQMVTLGVGSLMGHFYKQLETVEAWLVEHGIEPDQAASATSSYFTTFNVASRPALARPGLFTELVEEQVVREIEAAGGYEAMRSAMDNILARALGKR